MTEIHNLGMRDNEYVELAATTTTRSETSDRSQLAIDIFPLIPIGSLEQILDENWFTE